jgi:thioredoxin reductase (NADPH)
MDRSPVRRASEAFEGERSTLGAIRVRSGRGAGSHLLEVPGAFVFIGLDPNSSFLAGSGVRLDERGFVVTGGGLIRDGRRPAALAPRDPGPWETSVPGVFAVGDLRSGSTKQVASAAGEGASAALSIREHLADAERRAQIRSIAPPAGARTRAARPIDVAV